MPFASRNFQTTLYCTSCHTLLRAVRGCQEVRLHCPGCKKTYALEQFGTTLDELMEEHLANIPCNRL